MPLETKHHLNAATIDQLQQLIRMNIDSYDGFHEAAERIQDQSLADLFRQLAQERSALATELQNYVEWNGKQAVDDGSLAAAVHRRWIDIRGMISGGDASAILAEAERGEDHIKQGYQDVLKATAGSAMNDVLQEQYAIVKAGHDKIRALRDGHQNA